MIESRPFRMPSTLITGPGAADSAGAEAAKLRCSRALIVTDRTMSELGRVQALRLNLSAAGVESCVFDDVTTEPTDVHVEDALRLLRQEECDVVIALGGGSPIDAAKAVALMSRNEGPITDYMGLNKVPNPGIPLMAIPTTAGTGSEVTIYIVVTDTKRDVKMLIGTSYAMPTISLVDPLLTIDMPRRITAATGLDALTHAIEAYVSVKAQPLTDAYALEAIRLISNNLRQAWANGRNHDARTRMMQAALMAGIAFSNASVALVHGMSRPLGARFHVPHGISNAALLTNVMEFSILGDPLRYAHIAGAMGVNTCGMRDIEAARAGVRVVHELVRDLDIPPLRDLGVPREGLDAVVFQMAKDAIASGSPGNNPRVATEDEIVELYYACHGTSE